MMFRAPRALALAAALLLAACEKIPSTPVADGGVDIPSGGPVQALGPGGLEWFGYATGVDDDWSLNGTESYANFGWVVTSEDTSSTWVTQRANAAAGRGMKVIVELGKILWCGTDFVVLCPDYAARWASWRRRNSSVLTPDTVLAFVIRDEPFHWGVSPAQYEAAAQLVKNTYPEWAKIVLIEALYKVENPASDFNTDRIVQTVDLVGVAAYDIHPDTSSVFRRAIDNLKVRFNGRKRIYVGDGFWSAASHPRMGGLDAMGAVAQRWFLAAQRDPEAVLLGFFIWERVPPYTTSRDFPPPVLLEHTKIGREITGRRRSQHYQPTGRLAAVTNDGYVRGWACDPDAAWGEVVRVDVYNNGQLVASGLADRDSANVEVIPACRSGNRRNFWISLPGTIGRQVTVVAHDLDSGSATLPTTPWVKVAWVQTSAATWGPPNTLTAAGWARNGSGGVQLQWRDATTASALTTTSYAAEVALGDASWSNTVPVSNYCHNYQVRAVYSGVTSPIASFWGQNSGYCNEKARVIWIQPSSTAGIGSPGSLVVAGEATGAPAGTLVSMWYRDLTANGAWIKRSNEAGTDPNGIWLNDIPNADYTHRYAVYAKYDVITTSTCTYAGTSSITWC
ncbi:MAG TPA: hypothetical protein VFQ45_12670 [Longimicrobium sp.]|nr:hypothetical protein [Longimicrobium sp.]